MNHIRTISVMAGLLVLGGVWAGADQERTASTYEQQQAVSNPVETNELSATGTVQKIDSTNRNIQIKTSDGNLMRMNVSPQVSELNTLKKGDQIQVQYLQPVALSLQSTNTQGTAPVSNKTANVVPRSSATGRQVAVETTSGTVVPVAAAPGTVTVVQTPPNSVVSITDTDAETPAPLTVNTEAATTHVESVDRQNDTVTLKDMTGNKLVVKADSAVPGYDQIKEGDQIVAEYTQPVVLDIQRS